MGLKEVLGTAKDCGAVIKWAVITRTCLLVLQAISHNLIPDHHGSMEDVFMKAHRSPPHDIITETAFGGLDNWDSEYFMFIAQHGYHKFEQSMAFFPLYPLLMHTLSNTIFYPLNFLTSYRSVVLVSGVAINFITFPLATSALYLLTHEITQNRRLSFLAAALFCINPASVFMTAVYTECLFAVFAFLGLFLLEKHYDWLAAICFSLAVATRSNGILLCGFLAFKWLLYIHDAHSKRSKFSNFIVYALRRSIITTLQCLMVLLPFAVYQYYAYTIYCTRRKANSGDRTNSNSGRSWCEWDSFLPPLHYSHVQSYYWNVGFLRYFELKQIPNFLLATPMILLAVYSLVRFVSALAVVKRREEKTERNWLRRERIIPYMVHLAFLLLTGVFFMHVQVITRFVCSSTPVIYWISADTILHTLTQLQSAAVLEPKLYSFKEMSQRVVKMILCSKTGNDWYVGISKLLLGYFLVYTLLGYLFHCNFYPWT